VVSFKHRSVPPMERDRVACLVGGLVVPESQFRCAGEGKR